MCIVTFDWEKNDAIKKFHNFKKTKSVLWAIIELTDYCNFNCKWCFANAGAIRQPTHMNINDLENLVNCLADAGVMQITYSGGEPTLYPHIKQAISLAKNRGMVVHINTNGTLLVNQKVASELKEAGLSQVQTNIDSIYPEKHDMVRGKKGAFSIAMKALENSRSVGMTCAAQTVLTKENENEIIEIVKLARSLGVQRCRLWDMTPSSGRAQTNNNLLPKDYVAALQKLSDYAYETGARNVEVCDPIFVPHVKTKLTISGGYCVYASGIAMYISNKGIVHFCCTFRNKLYNIFDEIASGNNVVQKHKQSIRRCLASFGLPEGCQTCSHKDLCNGGCYTRRNFSGKNMDYWCRMGGG